MIKEWEAIQVKLLTQSRNDSEHKPKDLEAATIDVHRSLAALEEKLSAVAKNISSASGSVASLSQLNYNIQTLQVNAIILSQLVGISFNFYIKLFFVNPLLELMK